MIQIIANSTNNNFLALNIVSSLKPINFIIMFLCINNKISHPIRK